MTTKAQKNQFVKETRLKFKKAIAERNWRRAEDCIKDVSQAGFKAIAQQMDKIRAEEMAVDEDASKEENV